MAALAEQWRDRPDDGDEPEHRRRQIRPVFSMMPIALARSTVNTEDDERRP